MRILPAFASLATKARITIGHPSNSCVSPAMAAVVVRIMDRGGNTAKLFQFFWKWSLTTRLQSWYQRKLNLYYIFFNNWYWQQQWFAICYSSNYKRNLLKREPLVALFVVHKFHHNGEIWKLTTFYPSQHSVSKYCQFFSLKVRPILFAVTQKDHSARAKTHIWKSWISKVTFFSKPSHQV